MTLKFVCVKCGKPGFSICPSCRDKPVEIGPKVDPVIIDDVKPIVEPVVEPVSKSVNKVVNDKTCRSVGDLPVYSCSVLNNKMGYNHKSIVNEICCVKVKGGYVLNKDIIQSYRSMYGD